MKIRTTGIHVVPEGEPLFDECAYSIRIDDEGAGEFVVIRSMDSYPTRGYLRVDYGDWPKLREAIDMMIEQCHG